MPLLRFLRLLIACVCLLISTGTVRAAIQIGMTPDQVQAEIGLPNGERKSGNKTTWVYGDGARLTFENGRLVTVVGRDYIPAEGEKPDRERWLTPDSKPESETSGVRFTDGRETPSATSPEGVAFTDGRTYPTASRDPATVPFANSQKAPAKPTRATQGNLPTPTATTGQGLIEAAALGFTLPPELLAAPTGKDTESRRIAQFGKSLPEVGQSRWLKSWIDEGGFGIPEPYPEAPYALIPDEDYMAYALQERQAAEEMSFDAAFDELISASEQAPGALGGMTAPMGMDQGTEMMEEAQHVVESPLVTIAFFVCFLLASWLCIWVVFKLFNDEMLPTSMFFFALIHTSVIFGSRAILHAMGFVQTMSIEYGIGTLVMAMILPFMSCIKDHIRAFQIVFAHNLAMKGISFLIILVVFSQFF